MRSPYRERPNFERPNYERPLTPGRYEDRRPTANEYRYDQDERFRRNDSQRPYDAYALAFAQTLLDNHRQGQQTPQVPNESTQKGNTGGQSESQQRTGPI
jgi:hypothetical protein